MPRMVLWIGLMGWGWVRVSAQRRLTHPWPLPREGGVGFTYWLIHSR